jgi:hypothetical protein
MWYQAFRKGTNPIICYNLVFLANSFLGIARLFPQVNQLADKAVVALAGSAVAVELVLSALFYAYGGPGPIRFFCIVAHVHSCRFTDLNSRADSFGNSRERGVAPGSWRL